MYILPFIQLAYKQPRRSFQRLITGSFWLFCITFWAVYSGNLVAFLTVYKENLPFETMDDVAMKDTSGYKVGLLGGGIYESWLKVENCIKFNNQ